ncbi:MAG: hypothetical protein EON59_01410 [Alphaproteobacteria bacterium]|nr:MAG: hypothetical protein EON59_01410 [Alphaproteobacteria bacterium]
MIAYFLVELVAAVSAPAPVIQPQDYTHAFCRFISQKKVPISHPATSMTEVAEFMTYTRVFEQTGQVSIEDADEAARRAHPDQSVLRDCGNLFRDRATAEAELQKVAANWGAITKVTIIDWPLTAKPRSTEAAKPALDGKRDSIIVRSLDETPRTVVPTKSIAARKPTAKPIPKKATPKKSMPCGGKGQRLCKARAM